MRHQTSGEFRVVRNGGAIIFLQLKTRQSKRTIFLSCSVDIQSTASTSSVVGESIDIYFTTDEPSSYRAVSELPKSTEGDLR